jgi:hypothetical protein
MRVCFVGMLAVLQNTSAVLVNIPDDRLRTTPLHGSVEVGLVVWQSVSNDYVGHGNT